MSLLHLSFLPARTSKGDLLKLLRTVGGMGRQHVGKIDLRGALATAEVPREWTSRLVKALDGAQFKGRCLQAWATEQEDVVSVAEDHFQRLDRLLQLESEAEAQQTLADMRRATSVDAERTGTSLNDLVLLEEDFGLGGRCILGMGKRNRSLSLPWNRLEPGTPVLLSPEERTGSDGWRGVVCERQERAIYIALNEPPEEDERPLTWRLVVAGDELARQRQSAALQRARTASRERLAELRAVLLGETDPAFHPQCPIVPLDDSLNASQQEAVSFALSAKDLAILHGPPGTGKTTTLVELIRQAVRRGDKVLACAPSNLAVDNLLERLVAHGEKVVRLGHPARVLPALREHTLDLLVQEHASTRQARKLAKEAFSLFRQANKFTRARPEPGARQQTRQEARSLLADARKLESQAIERIVDGANIVCATLTGLNHEVLGQRNFDLAVIDEASQSTEPACWLPVLRSRRLVLAGDHCQLPPTVISQEAAQEGFGVSLMERMAEWWGEQATRRLEVQYRMHKAIMEFSSRQFYDGGLQAHDSVSKRLLCDLPGVQTDALTQAAVRFIDTAGAGFDEQLELGGESKLNPQEAELVCRNVRLLLEVGVAAQDVAVIAPYAAQVRLLRERLPIAGLEIDSVDGFQGREKEAVVLSLVRSNLQGEVGFLADVRRMNVALTRARRHLLVIGDSATLSSHPFYQDMFSYFESLGAYSSVWEEH